jgi:hypothetical protein
MKNISKVVLSLGLVLSVLMPTTTSAHQSGCHRWHSCLSDTGSYVCGDLGYTSGCPKKTTVTKPTVHPAAAIRTKATPAVPANFVGIPKTYDQLYKCTVVGNGTSKIYHLKGSKYIREMNLKQKTCFSTEKDAVKAGYRKSKI